MTVKLVFGQGQAPSGQTAILLLRAPCLANGEREKYDFINTQFDELLNCHFKDGILQGILKGEVSLYLLFNWFGISCMTQTIFVFICKTD
jgi:hypothetical protein